MFAGLFLPSPLCGQRWGERNTGVLASVSQRPAGSHRRAPALRAVMAFRLVGRGSGQTLRLFSFLIARVILIIITMTSCSHRSDGNHKALWGTVLGTSCASHPWEPPNTPWAGAAVWLLSPLAREGGTSEKFLWMKDGIGIWTPAAWLQSPCS